MSMHYCDTCQKQTWWKMECTEHPSTKDLKIKDLELDIQNLKERLDQYEQLYIEIPHLRETRDRYRAALLEIASNWILSWSSDIAKRALKD